MKYAGADVIPLLPKSPHLGPNKVLIGDSLGGEGSLGNDACGGTGVDTDTQK